MKRVHKTKSFIAAYRRYGFLGTIRLLRDIFLTKCISNQIRLIRYPFYIRGRAGIDFGKGFTSGVGLRIDAFGSCPRQVVIGTNVEVGDYVHIGALESVHIGDNVLIASKVYISDHDHGRYSGDWVGRIHPEEVQSQKLLEVSPVRIDQNVWIGENVCILKGVQIGENSIIGAASVVTKSVPPNSIAIGVPAKVIKQYDFSISAWVDYDA